MKKNITMIIVILLMVSTAIYSENTPVEVKSIEEFHTIITASAQPVVAQFHSGCAICNATRNHVKEVMSRYPNLHFIEVDINKVPNLAECYSITALPTILIFNSSSTEPVFIITGPKKDELESKIKEILLQ